MDEFLQIADKVNKFHNSLKKYCRFRPETKQIKIVELKILKDNAKRILRSKSLDESVQLVLFQRYKTLSRTINECLELLKEQQLEESNLQDLFEEGKVEEEIGEEEEEEESEPFCEVENFTMAALDLGLALKIIDKFNGDSLELGHFLETVDLLKAYSANVPEANLITFIKTRLVSSAHGAIEGATTIDEAKQLLTTKFAVKLTPMACEAELKQIRQHKQTITEFGKSVEQLAAKLATAHVSTKTFANEAAADAIVQPVAINAFITGLGNPQTAFFVKARNPPTLNRAISDALEVVPVKNEEINWYQSYKAGGSYRHSRGMRPGNGNFNRRGNYRGRGYHHGPENNFNHHSQRGHGRGRGGRGHFRNSYQGPSHGNSTNHRRNGNTQHTCNCVHGGNEQEREPSTRNENPAREEVNVIQELFRE